MSTNDEVLHRFLKISYYLNKDPSCADRDLHSCNGLCDNECEKIKFLLPIMEEMKKGDISNNKKTKQKKKPKKPKKPKKNKQKNNNNNLYFML